MMVPESLKKTNIRNFCIGSFRWRAPRAPSYVSGVQQANTEPNECYQFADGSSSTSPFLNTTTLNKRAIVPSEDCLFLK